MEKFALLSVSDRSNLEVFAKGLVERGFSLLTTSGTGRYLAEHNIPFVPIEDYTEQPEILGGRVKTLHPKIHGGILARRSHSEDQVDLAKQQIHVIDVVAVNLYPFEQQLQKNPHASTDVMIEFIDIGGPTMIRAAAKNCQDVFAVIDPADYDRVLAALEKSEETNGTLELRRELSAKVFAQLAHYNLEIARYLSRDASREDEGKSSSLYSGQIWKVEQMLRYGENPQQEAVLYGPAFHHKKTWKQLAGKELSYNNILDADAGYRLIRSLHASRDRFGGKEVVCIMKHLTPCGVAIADQQAEALQRAKQSDPRSHFGGIVCFASQVKKDSAEAVISDFSEIVIAPSFSEEALAVLKKRPNVRLIECDYSAPIPHEIRSTLFGVLQQAPDLVNCSVNDCELVAGDKLSIEVARDLELAWCSMTYVKSNAITLVKDGMLIGAGAGQTSRIDAVEVALYKAREHSHPCKGAVAASDAFFPFPDSVESLAAEGVQAIITPGGSKKDPEVIQTAKKLGVALVFAPERHFRH